MLPHHSLGLARPLVLALLPLAVCGAGHAPLCESCARSMPSEDTAEAEPVSLLQVAAPRARHGRAHQSGSPYGGGGGNVKLAAELADGRLSYLAGGPYSAQDVSAIAVHLAANMFPNGTVLASPSNGSTIGIINGTLCAYPDYYYMWQRDAALTMRSLLQALVGSKIGAESLVDPSSAAFSQFTAYARLAAKQWAQQDPNTDCPPSLKYCPPKGEPKYYVNGSVYNQPWGRPQNDGPALLALVLVEYANIALEAGHDATWLATQGFLAPLKEALHFVQFYYMEGSIGPWENRYAQHFYVTAVQRRALAVGAVLAGQASMAGSNLASSASNYGLAANKSLLLVEKFWVPEEGIVRARLGDLYDYWPPRCFRSQSNATNSDPPCSVDIQVLLGSVYSMARGTDAAEFPSALPPYDSRILATADMVVKSMAPFYVINQVDDEQGLPGILIGRFPGDNYQGYAENGSASSPNSPTPPVGPLWGNPWYLTTNFLAELLYQVAIAAAEGKLEVDELSQGFLSTAPGWAKPADERSTSDICLTAGANRACAEALVAAGDGVLVRAKAHALPGLHLSEQIEGHYGHPFPPGAAVSAADLSWSYSSVLDALAARTVAVGLLSKQASA